MYGPHVLAACAHEPPALEVPRESPGEWLHADATEPLAFELASAAGAGPLRLKPLSCVVDEDYHVYHQFPS